MMRELETKTWEERQKKLGMFNFREENNKEGCMFQVSEIALHRT